MFLHRLAFRHNLFYPLPVSTHMNAAPGAHFLPVAVRPYSTRLLHGHVSAAHQGLPQVVKTMVDVVIYIIYESHTRFQKCCIMLSEGLLSS